MFCDSKCDKLKDNNNISHIKKYFNGLRELNRYYPYLPIQLVEEKVEFQSNKSFFG